MSGMDYRNFGENSVLGMEAGNELDSKKTDFCRDTAGKICGIGAVSRAKPGFFDRETGDYQFKKILEDKELVGLMGNISSLAGKPFPLHAVLAGSDFQVIGGHLSEAEISVTAEISLEPMDGFLERKYYQENGLNLLALSD
jgi:predicted DNA-binding protein with PD1-like motif